MAKKIISFLAYFFLVIPNYGQNYVFHSSLKKFEYKKGTDWVIPKKKKTILNQNTYVKCKSEFIVIDNTNRKRYCCPSIEGLPLYKVLDKYVISKQDDGKVWTRDGNIFDVAQELNESMEKHESDSINFHYLIVDIHDFEDSTWGNIGLPKVDSRAIEDALNNYIIPNNAFLVSYKKVLTDLKNTCVDSIKSNLAMLLESVKEDIGDVVFLYLSSHGTIGKDGKFYFITSDTSVDAFTRTIHSYISEDDICKYIRDLAFKNARVLVFIDACYSGTILRNLGDDEILKRNVAIYTSTANDLSAFQDREGSPFALALTSAMSGEEQLYFKKNNNVVTPYLLETYIRESVNKKHPGQDPQSVRGLELSPKTPLWTISEEKSATYIASLRRQVTLNNSDALIELGKLYKSGDSGYGIPHNPDSAFVCFSKAFELGDKQATIPLAQCYYYGEGVKQDYVEALDLFKVGETEENDVAYYYLSVYYSKGILFKKSKKQARQMMKKIKDPTAFELGKASLREGIPLKGIMLENGEEVEDVTIKKYNSKEKHILAEYGINVNTNQEYIISHTHRVTDEPSYDWKAEKGNAHAQAMLGRCYLYGIDKPRNFKMAIKWLNKSALKDDGDAFYYLYICYSQGWGVQEDKQQALNYLERAVEKDIPNAWIEMGNHYFFGDLSLKADDKEAFLLWQKAAKKGHPVGQYKVGLCYKYGIGVEPDEIEAIGWLLKSAKNKKYGDGNGYSNAQYELGKYYFLNKNFKEAYNWLLKAKKQGNSNAKKLMTKYFYSNGKVKKQNNES